MSSQQDQVGQWGNETFPMSTPITIVRHLRREIDELIEAVERMDGLTSDEVEEEAADCQMMLYHLADRCFFSLQDAVAVKFALNQKRAWGEPDADGVVEHVR